ncbi:MAG: Rrf2 family transcriptional regulator [Gammaproteobacteria bacterium]|nr:Rrf2 family transcriptional regulator [Gammaproteobacteria bacterium]
MKIPTKGRYAVSAMMDLAIHDKIKPLTIAEIAEKQNISLSYLEQLFAVLRRNKLVRGTRGPGGGYRLAQPASTITVAQIIRTVDASVTGDGLADDEYLPYALWAELSRKMYQFLDGITLAECVDHPEVNQRIESQEKQEQTGSAVVAA